MRALEACATDQYIDVSDLQTGIYFLIITTEEGTTSFKLLKE